MRKYKNMFNSSCWVELEPTVKREQWSSIKYFTIFDRLKGKKEEVKTHLILT